MTRVSRIRDQQSRLAAVSSVGLISTSERRTHEEIVGIWDVSSYSEELHEVVELAMDIATYLRFISGCSAHQDPPTDRYWRINTHHIAFLYQELSCFVA